MSDTTTEPRRRGRPRKVETPPAAEVEAPAQMPTPVEAPAPEPAPAPSPASTPAQVDRSPRREVAEEDGTEIVYVRPDTGPVEVVCICNNVFLSGERQLHQGHRGMVSPDEAGFLAKRNQVAVIKGM